MRRLISATLLATLVVPAVASAQQGEFRWDRAVAAGKEVSIHNISGNIKVTPSTSGKVEVVGVKHGNSRYFDRIKADVQETSRGVVVCVLYDTLGLVLRRPRHALRQPRRPMDDGRDGNDVEHVARGRGAGEPARVGEERERRRHRDGRARRRRRVQRERRRPAREAPRRRRTANTVSGDVDVQVDEFTGRGDLVFHSVSGDITLDAPRNFDADISMSTVSGDINSDFPLVAQRRSHAPSQRRSAHRQRWTPVRCLNGERQSPNPHGQVTESNPP